MPLKSTRGHSQSATAVKFEDDRATAEFKSSLIDFVRNNPLLWDPGNEDYLNNGLKRSTWNTFCRLYYSNVSVDSVKKSWKSLRDSFRREHCKILKKGPNNDGTEKWAFYDAMIFLKDVIEEETDVTDANGLNATTSQANTTVVPSKSRRRTRTVHSNELAPEQVLDQILNVNYDNNVSLVDKFNAPTTATAPANAFLKLERLNHKLDTLLKSNQISTEPNYSFVISLLEMLRCIKDEKELAILKGKIYKLIADSIAAQK